MTAGFADEFHEMVSAVRDIQRKEDMMTKMLECILDKVDPEALDDSGKFAGLGCRTYNNVTNIGAGPSGAVLQLPALVARAVAAVDDKGRTPMTPVTPPTRGTSSAVPSVSAGEVSNNARNSKRRRGSCRSESGTTRMHQLVEEATRMNSVSSGCSYQYQGVVHMVQFMAGRLVKWRRFEHLMGAIIMVNAVCIGFDTQQRLEARGKPMEKSTVFEDIEHVFLVIYVLELIARVLANGRKIFLDPWFLFDLFLVCIGSFSSWIWTPITKSQQRRGRLDPGFDTGPDRIIGNLLVFRMLRLLRLLRALRMMQHFRSMWRLVYGLLTSFDTILSTLSLLTLVLYICACLGVELIAQDPDLYLDPSLEKIMETNFSSLGTCIMFLVQFVTLDSVAAVYMPICEKKPLLIIYFVGLILVVSISLMNLVMAKIVEGALDAASKDRELENEQRKEQIRSLMPKLRDLFQRMDKDGSRKVELQEVENIDVAELPEDLANLLKIDSMRELFEILDVDGSGEIEQDEFVDGVLLMNISDQPVSQMEQLKLIRVLRTKVGDIEEQIAELTTNVDLVRRGVEVPVNNLPVPIAI